ncbi:MAG: alpha/beta fold hydrolase [Byssovorax sp.]
MFLKRLAICLGATIMVACAGAPPPRAAADPVTEDPAVVDPVSPAVNRMVEIPSGGVRMSGVLFVASGAGPHPTVILLHGFPGHAGMRDIAEAIRRAGWNVLTFQYRGMWGSEGDFSLAHVLEDATAAVAFIRGPAGRAGRSSPDDIVLMGHSMGGWAALSAAASDDGIRAVATLAGWNSGPAARELDDPAELAAAIKDNEQAMLPLRGTSGAAVAHEVQDRGAEWDVVTQSPRLAGRPLFLVAATRDRVTPPAAYHAPLVAALEREPGAKVKALVLDTDHGFTEKRITLARALVAWLSALPIAPTRSAQGR